MIKSVNIKTALLLVLLGIMLIALIEPIAGNMLGQENMTGQKDMMAACPENKTYMLHCMMKNMEEHSANETMMYCIMENRSANETMMWCIMGGHLANKTMSQSIMGNYSANETMIQPMMGNYSATENCFIVAMDQNASSAQARLDCTRFWLEKAMELHELHLKDATTTTNESQIELMNRITRAYECVTGENATREMINTTTGQTPTGDEHWHQA